MIIDELVALLGYDLKGQENLDRFNRGLDRAQQRAEKVANRINMMSVAIGSFLGQIAVGFAHKIGDTIGSMPSDVLKVGQQFENLGIRLETLEGSSEKGREALAWVKKFAEDTPLDLAEAADAYADLKNFGVDPMNGSLLALTDAMAASGQGTKVLGQLTLALGQAWAKGKLQGQEILQFINAGIPVWEMLEKATGKNAEQLQKLAQKGQLGRDVIQKLTDEIGKKYAGAGEKMAKTQRGVLDRMGDLWTDFLKRIADSGYYDFITRKLKGVQDTLERWSRDGTMDAWAKSISNGFIQTVQAGERWARGIARVGELLAGYWKQISLGNIDLSKWQALAVFAGVLLAAFAPMVATILAAGLALDDFFGYLTGAESITGDLVNYFSEAWSQILSGLDSLLPGVSDAISGIKTAFMSADWMGVSTGMAKAIATGFSDIYGIIVGYLTSAWNGVAGIDWLGLGATVGNAIIAGLHDIPAALLALGPSLMLNLMEAVATVDWGSIGEAVGQSAVPIGAAAVVGILLGIKGLGDALAAVVLGIIDALVAVDWSRVGKAFLGYWEGILKLLLGFFVGLGKSIADAVKAWFDIDLVDIGVRMGRSLLNGLVSVGESIRGWFASLLPDWAKGWFAEANDRKQAADAGAEVGALVGPPPAPVEQGAPPPKPVASSAPAKTADPATKILSAGRAAVSAFETAAQVAVDRVAAYAAERKRQEGSARPGRTSISEEAGRNNVGGMDQVRSMLENMNANLAKMTPEKAVQATITDARQDNRQFPVTVNSTVNQTVTQASQAPAAAARATSQAVGQAAVPQAGRLAVDSAF